MLKSFFFCRINLLPCCCPDLCASRCNETLTSCLLFHSCTSIHNHWIWKTGNLDWEDESSFVVAVPHKIRSVAVLLVGQKFICLGADFKGFNLWLPYFFLLLFSSFFGGWGVILSWNVRERSNGKKIIDGELRNLASCLSSAPKYHRYVSSGIL